MDRQGSDFWWFVNVRDMLKSNAATHFANEENDFKGMDLVKNEVMAWWYARGDFDVVAIPEEIDEVKEYRSILIEAVADYDENLLRNSWKMKTLLQRKKSTKH
jgi:elongation factor G